MSDDFDSDIGGFDDVGSSDYDSDFDSDFDSDVSSHFDSFDFSEDIETLDFDDDIETLDFDDDVETLNFDDGESFDIDDDIESLDIDDDVEIMEFDDDIETLDIDDDVEIMEFDDDLEALDIDDDIEIMEFDDDIETLDIDDDVEVMEFDDDIESLDIDDDIETFDLEDDVESFELEDDVEILELSEDIEDMNIEEFSEDAFDIEESFDEADMDITAEETDFEADFDESEAIDEAMEAEEFDFDNETELIELEDEAEDIDISDDLDVVEEIEADDMSEGLDFDDEIEEVDIDDIDWDEAVEGEDITEATDDIDDDEDSSENITEADIVSDDALEDALTDLETENAQIDDIGTYIDSDELSESSEDINWDSMLSDGDRDYINDVMNNETYTQEQKDFLINQYLAEVYERESTEPEYGARVRGLTYDGRDMITKPPEDVYDGNPYDEELLTDLLNNGNLSSEQLNFLNNSIQSIANNDSLSPEEKSFYINQTLADASEVWGTNQDYNSEAYIDQSLLDDALNNENLSAENLSNLRDYLEDVSNDDSLTDDEKRFLINEALGFASETNGTAGDIYQNPASAEGIAEVNSPAEVTESINEGTVNEYNEPFSGELSEQDIDTVYEGLNEYDFHGVDCLQDTGRLDSSLENFTSENWENLSLQEQKDNMTDLAQYIIDVTGLENPPTIEFYNSGKDGDYGGFNRATNTLSINEHMLYQNDEAADTVAHELWHAYQYERASNPSTKLDYMYLENFEDYITPDDDFEGYQSQILESEARAFAQQIKDRLHSY